MFRCYSKSFTCVCYVCGEKHIYTSDNSTVEFVYVCIFHSIKNMFYEYPHLSGSGCIICKIQAKPYGAYRNVYQTIWQIQIVEITSRHRIQHRHILTVYVINCHLSRFRTVCFNYFKHELCINTIYAFHLTVSCGFCHRFFCRFLCVFLSVFFTKNTTQTVWISQSYSRLCHLTHSRVLCVLFGVIFYSVNYAMHFRSSQRSKSNTHTQYKLYKFFLIIYVPQLVHEFSQWI